MDSKPIWKSKTFWFNVIAGGVAVLSALDIGFTGELDPSLEPYIVPIVAVINLILRAVTKSAVYLRS
jgi:hypothetical protein